NSINETRSREHRVSPLIHWSRAGMICKARHSHVPIPYSDYPLDHSDVDSFRVEHAPLLDMQLEISCKATWPQTGSIHVFKVSPDISYALSYGLAAISDKVELLGTQPHSCGHAPNCAALLVLKDHDPERVPGYDHVFGQRLSNFDRTQ